MSVFHDVSLVVFSNEKQMLTVGYSMTQSVYVFIVVVQRTGHVIRSAVRNFKRGLTGVRGLSAPLARWEMFACTGYPVLCYSTINGQWAFKRRTGRVGITVT